MASKKYDWSDLKDQFVSGDLLSISDFFREKRISNSSYTRTKTKGWLDARKNYQESIRQRAREKLVDKEAEVRIRHSKLAKALQFKGLKHLSKLKPKNLEEARKILVSGVEIEREAFDLSKKRKKTSSLTQVNVSFPKTTIDEFLEKASYSEILLMVAEIKKEKARRKQLETDEISNNDNRLTK